MQHSLFASSKYDLTLMTTCKHRDDFLIKALNKLDARYFGNAVIDDDYLFEYYVSSRNVDVSEFLSDLDAFKYAKEVSDGIILCLDEVDTEVFYNACMKRIHSTN